jgi:hypothetical protein
MGYLPISDPVKCFDLGIFNRLFSSIILYSRVDFFIFRSLDNGKSLVFPQGTDNFWDFEELVIAGDWIKLLFCWLASFPASGALNLQPSYKRP